MVWSCEFTAFTKIFAWAGCAPEWPNVLKMQFPFLYKSQLYTRQNFAKRWKSWFGTHWPDFVENHPKNFRHVGFLQKMWGKSRSEGVFGISELQTILDTPQSLCFEREANLKTEKFRKMSPFVKKVQWIPWTWPYERGQRKVARRGRSGDLDSAHPPPSFPPTRAFLDSWSHNLLEHCLGIYQFNYGLGMKMQKSVFSKNNSGGNRNASYTWGALHFLQKNALDPPKRGVFARFGSRALHQKNGTRKFEVYPNK